MELIPGLPDDIAVQCLIRVSYQDFSSISSVCRRWKALLDLPHFSHLRKRFCQKVIVMALSDLVRDINNIPPTRITLFEPQFGNWTQLPELPGYSYGLPRYCRLASFGYSFVIMGGLHPRTMKAIPWVFIYNFVSRSWRRGKDMPGQPRYFFACASDNNRTVFVAGGIVDDNSALKSALSYDVVNDEWTPLPDMAHTGKECKGFFRQGRFQVICNCHAHGQVFDVEKWRWDEVVEDLKKLWMCIRLCVIGGNGKIYRFEKGKEVCMLGEGEDKFQQIATLPKERGIFPYMIEWDGNLLVMVAQESRVPSEAYVLDLRSGSWKQVKKPIEYSGYIQSHCCLDI